MQSRWALSFAATCLLLGCAPVDPSTPSEDAEDEGQGVSARRVLLCEQGLSDRTMEWDKGLFDLCEAAEDEGFELIRDGDYPAFGALDEGGAYEALFAALDTNHNGIVSSKDQPALVYLVGFSWGGINVTDIAERLRKDDRVTNSRRGVAGLVLLDAFQPQISRARIPSNVLRAWVYRQTDTTEGDCSTYASLGFGFNGHRALAKSEMTICSEYDVDELAAVGHCDMPVFAREAALANLTEGRDYAPWADLAKDCALN